MKTSKYRKAKPETPGSRIYWNAYVRWEEYCKEATYKYVIKKKPFFQFLIEEIDLALQEQALSLAKTALSATAEALTDIHTPIVPEPQARDLQAAGQTAIIDNRIPDSTSPNPDNT